MVGNNLFFTFNQILLKMADNLFKFGKGFSAIEKKYTKIKLKLN